MTRGRRAHAAWLAAFGAAALASAAEPTPPPEQPETDPDAELLEFLGTEDGSDDMWAEFLAWLETTADVKSEKPPPKAEGETDD